MPTRQTHCRTITAALDHSAKATDWQLQISLTASSEMVYCPQPACLACACIGSRASPVDCLCCTEVPLNVDEVLVRACILPDAIDHDLAIGHETVSGFGSARLQSEMQHAVKSRYCNFLFIIISFVHIHRKAPAVTLTLCCHGYMPGLTMVDNAFSLSPLYGCISRLLASGNCLLQRPLCPAARRNFTHDRLNLLSGPLRQAPCRHMQ